MELIIAGDLAPTESNADLFINGDINALLGEEMSSLWNSSDMRIFNLETPLTDIRSPIAKHGPHLIAPTGTVKGIKALQPTLVTLANNHILDQGQQGLRSTESVLRENGIQFTGVGDDLLSASKPQILENNGIRTGIYACAEHEFSIATEKSAGANPFDPLKSLWHIRDLKASCDYVIVLYHGGEEHYRYPSPYLRKVCRRMAENGADLVVCQHSHCIGCIEEYDRSVIVYGQGNLLFDGSNSEFWQTGLLLKVNMRKGLNIEYIPIVKTGSTVRLADEKQRKAVLQGLEERSEDIRQEGFIERKYKEHAEDMIDMYLAKLRGNSLFYKILDRLLLRKSAGLLYSSNTLMQIRNIIECEAHRELLLEGLKTRSKGY